MNLLIGGIDHSISAEGAKQLSDALKKNTTLTKLSLESWTHNYSWKKGSNEKMVKIGNDIGVESVKRICEMLKVNNTLTSLNLSGEEEIQGKEKE